MYFQLAILLLPEATDWDLHNRWNLMLYLVNLKHKYWSRYNPLPTWSEPERSPWLQILSRGTPPPACISTMTSDYSKDNKLTWKDTKIRSKTFILLYLTTMRPQVQSNKIWPISGKWRDGVAQQWQTCSVIVKSWYVVVDTNPRTVVFKLVTETFCYLKLR